MGRKALLACGIGASLLYVAIDILAATRWPGYSYTDQTISELQAIGTPTRPLVVSLDVGYDVLVYAFDVGAAIAFGAAPRMAANLPTPWQGAAERVNAYGYMLWVAVFAIALLRARTQRPRAGEARESRARIGARATAAG